MNRLRVALMCGILGAIAIAISPRIQWANGGFGKYLVGDFHNHTTFSDGTVSARELIERTVKDFGLDWFAQSGHGGAYSRDGRLNDPQYDGNATGEGNFWINTVGAANLKGDPAPYSYGQPAMWRWQSIQEYLYPITSKASRDYRRPIWSGLEWEVPGHEHASTGIIANQFNLKGNANPMAQFEYLFDMEDNDTSGGAGQGWTGKISNPPKTPAATYPHPGIDGHAKALAAVEWMQQHYPFASYMVPAHIERKGVWDEDKGGNNTGWNVEHFRDLNNAGPTVAFGFEGQPGHQAEPGRGGFSSSAVGGDTFGGTGYYSATIGGLWDALLGEGRNFWLFASSDYHTRGTESYVSGDLDDEETEADFWPGEYQKDYVFVRNGTSGNAYAVLDGMRRGNSFIVQGDLIDGLQFSASSWLSDAQMGETLYVRRGQKVKITIAVHDPTGRNNCPYSFNNPSLAQMGISQPLNKPKLDHIDLIGGSVTGKIDPSDPEYKNPNNPTTEIKAQISVSHMKRWGDWSLYTFEFTPQGDCYYRLRGTNLPPGTLNETDSSGNPLADSLASNITYYNPVKKSNITLDTDVEAWSDLWFYSNPIFIRVIR